MVFVVGGTGASRPAMPDEELVVALGRGPPQLEDALELLELAEPDRGLDVRPAVVEAEPRRG